VKLSKGKETSSKKVLDKMLLVPSLKHRINKVAVSEKRISLVNSLQNIEAPITSKHRYGKY